MEDRAIPAIIVRFLTDQYFGFPLDKAFLPFSHTWIKNITWT